MQMTIFVSYSWENKAIADEVETRLNQIGCTVYRDLSNQDLQQGKIKLPDFMQMIRKTDYVVFLISDAFLHSENCMYEVTEFFKDEERLKKAVFAVIDSPKKELFTPDYALRLILDWSKRIEEREADVRLLKPNEGMPIREQISKWHDCRKSAEKIVSLYQTQIPSYINVEHPSEEDYQGLVQKILQKTEYPRPNERASLRTSHISLHETPPPSRQKHSHKKHYIRYLLIVIFFLLSLFSPVLAQVLLDFKFPLLHRIVLSAWIVIGALYFLNKIETDPNIASLCYGTITEEDLNLPPDELCSRILSVFGSHVSYEISSTEYFPVYYKMKQLEFGSWDTNRINYLNIYFNFSLKYYDPTVFYLHTLSRGNQAIQMLSRQGFFVRSLPSFVPPVFSAYLEKDDIHLLLQHKKRKLLKCLVLQCTTDEFEKFWKENWVCGF